MVNSRKTLVFSLIILSFTVLNFFFLSFSIKIFPIRGGFSRQILFVKPDEEHDGYFIVIDELAPEAQEHDVDWLLHGRGNLNISSDKQSITYTVPSYITGDNVSLKAYFLEDIDDIKEYSGFFYPRNLPEEYPDQSCSYISKLLLNTV